MPPPLDWWFDMFPPRAFKASTGSAHPPASPSGFPCITPERIVTTGRVQIPVSGQRAQAQRERSTLRSQYVFPSFTDSDV